MIGLWRKFGHRRARQALRDTRLAFLFDPPPADEWISLDCETSSLDPHHAEILSIAAIPVCGQRIMSSRALRLRIRPERPIPPASIPIHLLREQDLSDGLDRAEALDRLLHFIGPRPLVGYYLEFDLGLLNRDLLPRMGIALPNAAIDVSERYYDRRVSPYRPEVDLSLDAILRDLALPDLPRHDPFNDALLAALIFLRLRAEAGGRANRHVR